MKYKSEFEQELNLCLNSKEILNRYDPQDIYDILLEYWNKKDTIISDSLYKPEFYEKVNNIMSEFKKLTAQQKKTYLQMKIKELKFKNII